MRNMLLGSTALALVLAITPASAQMQQKGSGEEKSAPQATEKGKANESAEPKAKGESARKGAAQSDSKQKGAETKSKEQGTKGTAESQPKDGTKSAAEPKDKSSKGTAQSPSLEKGNKGTAETQPQGQGKGSAANAEKSRDRVQLSEQQRTSVHETVLKEKNVNRVNQVNFSISMGTRVPRSIHLVALPAAVITLVPQYRGYQYFVANDEICIVEPSSYEIIEVIPASGKSAQMGERGGPSTLMLTAEEKHIITENVEMRGDSTMALGSLSEGSPVPREARLEAFPDVVVQKVPKIRGHKFFTTEGRIAIADERGGTIQLVIDAKR